MTNEGLDPVLDVPLYGRIAGLEKFRPTKDGLDLIFVSTERYKFCVLGIDPERKTFVTKSNGDLRDRNEAAADFGQLVFIDPESRMIGLHLYRGQLKIIPVNSKTGALHDAINLKLDELHVIDIKFLQGPTPIVAVLYQDQREMRHVKTYEISLDTKEILEGSWSRPNVEVGASLLVPLPLPLGGVLLLAERSITYFNGDKSKSLAIKPMLIRAYAQLGPERLLFADNTGRLWLLLLSLSSDGKSLSDFKLELLGEASTAAALAYLDNNVLFLGSAFGDSQLIRLCPERDPSTGDYLQLLENYTNIGPIVDMATVDIDRIDSTESTQHYSRNDAQASQNSSVGGATAYNLFNASTMPTPASTHTQLVTCSGAFKDGSLRVIRNGIGISEHAQLDLEGILRIFALPFGTESSSSSNSMAVDLASPLPVDKLLFLSYVSETRLLKISGEELEEIVLPGSSLAEPTLLAAALSLPHFLVQVTPQAIYIIDSDSKTQVEVWKPAGASQRLSVAATLGDIIAVGTGSTLHIFKFNATSKKLEAFCEPKALSRELSCVTLYDAGSPSSTASMDTSDADSAIFVAIGLWQENSIAIMSVEGNQLVDVLSEAMGGEMMARSVLFVSYEKSLTHLLVGMGDGSVNSYVFDAKTAKAVALGSTSSETSVLSARKRLTLGRQPVVLQSFFNKGKLNVLACGDRPTVIYGRHGKVVFAPLNLPHVVGVCELNTSEFPDALAFATKDALRIGSVEEIQRLHVRKIPVPGGEMGRRIVHHPAHRAYILATARYDIQDATGEETESCSVQLLDEVSFELLDVYRLQPHECAESAAVMNFGGDSKAYVVIGTGYVLPNEQEPSRGRVLIFEAETTLSGGSSAASANQQAMVKGKLKLVHEIEVKGMVWCAAPFMSSSASTSVSAATASAATSAASGPSGKLLISVAYAIQLYSWVENRDGERELKLECEHTNHMQALAIATRGPLIYVGDLMRGSSLLQYRPVDSRIEQLALDLRADPLLAVGILDDHHFIGAENSLNLLAVQYANGGPALAGSATTSSSAPSNPPQDPHTGASAEQREFLQPIGSYHLGDQANCFRRGTLVLPNPDPEALALPSLLYATVSGAIGVIASISKELFDQLNTIQAAMAKGHGIGGFEHSAWRAYSARKKTAPATNFIDGDLIESILEFSPQAQEKIATAVGMSAQDLIKLIESISQATH